MKKLTIILAAIFAMVGCTKNQDFDNTISRNRVELSVSAAKDMPEASRVAFDGSITNMIWEADDLINVHIAGTGETATFEVKELSDDCKSALFRAEIYEPEPIDSYYAYYPANTGFSGTNVYFIIPNEVTASIETPYLVASCEEVAMNEVELNFKPVTALLGLTLGFDAEKVIIESVNGESLSGVLMYNCAFNTFTQPTGNSSITVKSPKAGNTYYINLPEMTLSQGYKVTVVKDGAQMIKTVSYGKEKKFVAGEVTPLTIDKFEAISVNLCNVYTNFDLYKQGNSAANSTNGDAIFFDGACSFSGISSTLVAECGVNCAGTVQKGSADNKQFSVSNLVGLSQGSYEVYAYIKLQDGTVYKSASKTVHVTGLPYSIQFGNTANPSGWTVSNTKVGSTATGSLNIFSFNEGEAYAISPKFYIPANESAKVKAAFKMYAYTSVAGKFKPAIYIAASESDSKSNKVATLSSIITLPNAMVTDGWTNATATVNLTSSVGKICIHTSGKATVDKIPFIGTVIPYYPNIPTESCSIEYAF